MTKSESAYEIRLVFDTASDELGKRLMPLISEVVKTADINFNFTWYISAGDIPYGEFEDEQHQQIMPDKEYYN